LFDENYSKDVNPGRQALRHEKSAPPFTATHLAGDIRVAHQQHDGLCDLNADPDTADRDPGGDARLY